MNMYEQRRLNDRNLKIIMVWNDKKTQKKYLERLNWNIRARHNCQINKLSSAGRPAYRTESFNWIICFI